MPFCEHCGAQVSEASRFCRSCGAEQNIYPAPASQNQFYPEAAPSAPLQPEELFHAGHSTSGMYKRIAMSILLIGAVIVLVLVLETDLFLERSIFHQPSTLEKIMPYLLFLIMIIDIVTLCIDLAAVRINRLIITTEGVSGTGCVNNIGFCKKAVDFRLEFSEIITVNCVKGDILTISTNERIIFCYIQKPVKAKKLISRYINDLAYE